MTHRKQILPKAALLLTLSLAAPAFAQVPNWVAVGLSLNGCAQMTQFSVQLSVLANSCEQDRDCAPTSRCEWPTDGSRNNKPGQCVRHWAQAAQPTASQLFLRGRAIELREELALGAGPVTTWLATAEGISPATLGRAMRAHRRELIPLI